MEAKEAHTAVAAAPLSTPAPTPVVPTALTPCPSAGPANPTSTATAVTEVTVQDVAHVVASWTGIPVEQLTASESARLLRLEAIIQHERIVGQVRCAQRHCHHM